MEDEVIEFQENIKQIKPCENIEIDFIVVNREFNDLLMRYGKYNLASKEEYGSDSKMIEGKFQATFSGSWEDISIYQTHDGLDKYTIKTTKLFSICSSCLNEELYNEQKDEYYCPSCLEHRPWYYRLSELYQRVKSYLPERVKQ